MSEDRNKSNKKRIMAISSASYRGIPLYELSTGPGVGLYLGLYFYAFDDLEQATKHIDAWYDLKKN